MLDVAVVDWGTPGLAARCVGSLQSELFTSIELIDAKSRGWSYAKSVNSSLARGSAPYVLALNADTRMLEPPEKVLAIFEEHADVAVIGPRQIDDQGFVTHAGIFGENTAPRHRFWMAPLHEVDQLSNEWSIEAVTVSGAVYFARRTVWETLGGFLEMPHFYEETWLSYLARHRGFRVVYTGATTWEHLFNRSPVDPCWRAGVAAESREMFRAACAREGIECD